MEMCTQWSFALHCLCVHKQTRLVFMHIRLPGSFICCHFSNPGKIVLHHIIESMKRETIVFDLSFLALDVGEEVKPFVFQDIQH